MILKKIRKLFTSKFVGTGPSSYKKKKLPGRGLTKVEKHCFSSHDDMNRLPYSLEPSLWELMVFNFAYQIQVES